MLKSFSEIGPPFPFLKQELFCGYTLESLLVHLVLICLQKIDCAYVGSLQSEFLYVENAFRKLAIALPF